MMTWTPELEALIREVGDYTDAQMKDLLNPQAFAAASALRIAFRGAQGMPLMTKTCREAGFEFEGKWMTDLQKLVDVAEQNGSTAAEKIKKALPVAENLMAEFKQAPSGMLKKIKIAKQQNIQY